MTARSAHEAAIGPRGRPTSHLENAICQDPERHIQPTAAIWHHLNPGLPVLADADRIHRQFTLLHMEGKADPQRAELFSASATVHYKYFTTKSSFTSNAFPPRDGGEVIRALDRRTRTMKDGRPYEVAPVESVLHRRHHRGRDPLENRSHRIRSL